MFAWERGLSRKFGLFFSLFVVVVVLYWLEEGVLFHLLCAFSSAVFVRTKSTSTSNKPFIRVHNNLHTPPPPLLLLLFSLPPPHSPAAIQELRTRINFLLLPIYLQCLTYYTQQRVAWNCYISAGMSERCGCVELVISLSAGPLAQVCDFCSPRPPPRQAAY